MRTLTPSVRDQRVTLQQRVAGVDARGQAVNTWSDVATVWAQVQPLRGREFFAAGQMQSVVDVRIRINYRADVQPTWRVLWRNRAHDVSGVIDVDGKRQQLELMCASGSGDAR